MIRQLDGEGNVHLVLTPSEVVDVQAIIEAGLTAVDVGLARIFEPEKEVAAGMISAAYLLDDEQLVTQMMRIHEDHANDDHASMRAQFEEAVKRGRAAAKEHGYIGA